jgi:hypothetical protein
MKKAYALWFLILLAGFAILATGCSSKEAPTQPTASVEQNKPAEIQPTQEAAVEKQEPESTPALDLTKPMEITGRVAQTAEGFVISTNVFDYHVIDQDLSSMIGKTVRATGAVEEAQGKFTIDLESITEIETQ